MLYHSKLWQSATNTVLAQYILQAVCHDRNKPSPSTWEKIWHLLAIYISASWLRNAVGEAISQPSSPCRLRINISTELSAAMYKPYVSKSWGKLSRTLAAPAASFPVVWHWGGLAAPPRHGLALLLCQEQPQQWHCPGAVAATTASLFFKFWTPQKPPSLVFSMKTVRRRKKVRVLSCTSLLHGYCN